MKRIIIIVFLVCSCSKFYEQTNDILEVTSIKEYHEYLQDSFHRIPVDVLMLEKNMNEFTINVEFSNDLKKLYLKRWIFELDDSLSIEDNLKGILIDYDMNLVSPLCLIDTSTYSFSILTKQNVLLQGNILKDGYSNFIGLVYYNPK